MDKTPIQYRIEMSVSGGLGYNSKTNFTQTLSFYSDGLRANDVKNTPKGLNAHLREITNPEYRNHGKYVGFIFSSSGRRMNISTISRFRYLQMICRNQMLVDEAYNAEAKRRGRINTLFEGFTRKIFGNSPTILIDYLPELLVRFKR